MPTRHFWLRTLAVLAVAAIALGLRLRAVDRLPIDFDEDDYLKAGQHYAAAIAAGDWAEISAYDYLLEHPPLQKLVYGVVLTRLPAVPEVPGLPVEAAPAASLPQPHLQTLRLTSAIFGVLQVFALAVVSPLAGLFLAIHTYTIKYTSQVYLEALPAFTSTVAALAYLRSGVSNRSAGPNHAVWLSVSAAALGLTVAAKYIYGLIGLAIALHWAWTLFLDRRPDQWRALASGFWPLAGWGLLALSIFFVADPFLWPEPLARLGASLSFNVDYAQSQQVTDAEFPVWQPLAWLTRSVPWHPGVFLVSVDALLTLLALVGLQRIWRSENRQAKFWVFWFGVGLMFLLIWRTKWPQYILTLAVPVAMLATEGLRVAVWLPALNWWHRRGAIKPPRSAPIRRWLDLWRASPWLAPGVIVLILITIFPLFFQLAMALTDFTAVSIRDGLTGGVWRAVWEGLSGQAAPVEVDLFNLRTAAREVRYAGPGLLLQLFSGLGNDILVFEMIWTVLAVGSQTALGVFVALLLHRRGVRFKGWWRGLFILPWTIPEFVGALVWSQILEPRFGWLNLAAQTWYERADYPGAPTVVSAWREDPDLALAVLLLAGLWCGFSFMFLAATAGLKSIPHEIYEAAALDGAGGWQLFRRVTWPLLAPLIIPAVIIRSIFAFNQFYLFAVLRPPFPAVTLATLSYDVFNTNSGGGLFALSAALNIFAVVVLLLLILGFNRWSRASEGVTYA